MATRKWPPGTQSEAVNRRLKRTWAGIAAVAAMVFLLAMMSLWIRSEGDRDHFEASEDSESLTALTDGEILYRANCASCHGISGEGQLNWKIPNDKGVYPAPPHNNDGHTWHHSDQQLLDIIAQGGNLPTTAMPGFEDKLTKAQMETILNYIKTFWGPEEQEFQEQVTRSR